MDQHANFGDSIVAVAPSPSSSGVTLQVTAGDGAKFPTAPFNCTVCPSGTRPSTENAEIVRVTLKVGDTFTITRAQEGTAARSIQVGDAIFNAVTVKVFTDIEDAVTSINDVISVGGGVVNLSPLSQAVSVLSQGLSVETAARVAKDNTLSDQISVLSQAVSALSQGHSALSQRVSVLSSQVSTVSANVTNVTNASTTGSLAALSLMQSAINTVSNKVSLLSDRVTSVSAQVVSVDAHAAAASAAATSVLNFVNNVSVKVSGTVSVRGLQSVVQRISVRIAAAGGGGGSAGVSAQAASALSDAMSAGAVEIAALSNAIAGALSQAVHASTFGSIAALSYALINDQAIDDKYSAAVASINNVISMLSVGAGGSVGVSAQAASALSDAMSAGAAEVATLSAAIASINDVISGLTGGGGSVTSAEHASVVTRLNTVSLTSTGGTSINGLQTVVATMWNRISILQVTGGGSGAGSVTSTRFASVLSDALSAGAATASAIIHASTAGSLDALSLALVAVASVSTFLAALSVKVSGGTSTRGLQAIINQLSSRAGGGAMDRTDSTVGSLAAISLMQSAINTVSNKVSIISDRVTSISAQIVSVDAHAAAGSLAATSVETKVLASLRQTSLDLDAKASLLSLQVTSVNAFLASLSALSVNGQSTHGLQSILNAISNQISATKSAYANASTVGSLAEASNRVSADNALSVRIDTVSNLVSSNLSALVNASTVGSLAEASNRVSADNALSVRIDTASNLLSATRSAYANASTIGSIAALSFAVSAIDTVSNALSVAKSALVNASTTGSLAAISLMQSAINTNSDKISVISDRVTSISAQIVSVDAHAAAASAAATSVLNYVNNISIKSAAGSARGLQSVIQTISVRLAAAGGVTEASVDQISNAVSNEASVRISADNALSVRIDTVSNLLSATRSAYANASTVGSIAALSLAVSAIDTVSNAVSVAKSALVNASTTGSLAAISLMQSAINTNSDKISILSDRVTSVSAQVVSVDAHAAAASAAATSVLNYVNAISIKSAAGSARGLQSVIQTISVRIVAAAGTAMDRTDSTVGSLAAISLMQSAINTVSNLHSVLSDRVTSISTQIGSINTFLASLSILSVGGQSTHGLQSILNAISTKLSDSLSAGAATASAIIHASTVGSLDAYSLAVSAINTVSNQASINRSAMTNASTVGSIAALSFAIANDASVTSALGNASTVGSIAALSFAIANDASVSAAVVQFISTNFGSAQFHVLKTDTQVVSTGVLAKISGLSLSLAANGIYNVEGQVNYAPNATSGTAVFQIAMSATSQPIYANLWLMGPSAIAPGAPQAGGQLMFGGESAISGTPSILYSIKPGVSGFGHMVYFKGVIQCSTAAGILKLMVAASTVNNSGCTIRLGSYIRALRYAP